MEIKFYTLLYIDYKNKTKSHNGMNGRFIDQIKKYIKCCQTLDRTLEKFCGKRLTIITNDKKFIESLYPELKCIEIDFNFNTPKDIKFYSAHKKIDVFKYFSTLKEDEYSILLDSDIICINNLPNNFSNICNEKTPIYYDITEQVLPAYGEKIIQSKEKIMKEKSNGIWIGGEILGGDKYFYTLLVYKIELLKYTYIENYKNIHHQGDEMLVSCALELLLKEEKIPSLEIGKLKLISRYWSTDTKHIQEKIENLYDRFLLHLPADKEYLSSIKNIEKENIFINIKKVLKRKEKFLKIKKIIKKVIYS